MTQTALGPDEAHLWWFDADAPLPPGAEAVLEPAERTAADRLRRPEDRRRFLARRVARRRILSRYVDAEPAALRFETRCEHCGGPHGRPRLAGGPWFNASHAAGVGVLAVARRPVGVDAEAPERVGDARAVAARFFAPAERSRLDPSDPATFLRPWCAKEAYLKMRGLGLAAPLERLDTTLWHPDAPVADPLEPGRFRLLRPAVAGGRVAVALAVDGDAPVAVRVLRWPEPDPAMPAPSSG